MYGKKFIKNIFEEISFLCDFEERDKLAPVLRIEYCEVNEISSVNSLVYEHRHKIKSVRYNLYADNVLYYSGYSTQLKKDPKLIAKEFMNNYRSKQEYFRKQIM